MGKRARDRTQYTLAVQRYGFSPNPARKSLENCFIAKGAVPRGDLPCPRVSMAMTRYFFEKCDI